MIDKLIKKTKSVNRHFISAIILAGGSGSRMESDKPKQFMLLKSKPIISRTVEVFEKCDFINEIILVIRSEDMDLYTQMQKDYGWQKPLKFAFGGATRTESALSGFKTIDDESEYIMFHDGARCLITPEMIENVADDMVKYGSTIAASVCSDSVKLTENEIIKESIDRDKIRLAQTPQAFRTELYRAAVYTAVKNGDAIQTDDATLVSNIGFDVHITECGHENMKVTFPIDIAIAEAILDYRERCELK